MLVRHCRPIWPMSDPSRAYTSDDCGSAMIRHGSPVDAACCCAATGSARTMLRTSDAARDGMSEKRSREDRSGGGAFLYTPDADKFLHMPPTLDLALVQFKARKGNYRANLRRLGEIFGQLDQLAARPQVLILPETALTGYFVEGGVRDLAVTAGALARDLAEEYGGAVRGAHMLDVVVGFYE